MPPSPCWAWYDLEGTIDLYLTGVKPDQSFCSDRHTAWMGRNDDPIVLCLFSCAQSHSLLNHLPLLPFTLNRGTLNLSRELRIWVNVSVYHLHAVNYFVREIYRYPMMFGLSAPVHLEINKLLLEIPFVSQSWAQRTLLGVIFMIVALLAVVMLDMVVFWSLMWESHLLLIFWSRLAVLCEVAEGQTKSHYLSICWYVFSK